MINYIKNEVFKGQRLDKIYQDAISEFNKEKDNIKELMSSDSETAAKKLERLKITELTRQTPAEFRYDILLIKETNNEYISQNHTWTKRRKLGGKLAGRRSVGMVSVSVAASGGVYVGTHNPNFFHDELGVSFSRSR